MNIAPDVTQKAAIIQNTVEVARAIGIDLPKVAPIAADRSCESSDAGDN